MKYKIDLKPIGTFFFGSDKKFGEGDEVNYFAQSSLFPQQTSILGMLRKEILVQYEEYPFKEGVFDKSLKGLEDKLIGKAFIFNGINDFGLINSISPVYISNEVENFSFAPSSSEFILETKKNGKFTTSIEKNFIPLIVNNKKKDDIKIYSSKGSTCNVSDIFTSISRIGITKDREEDDDNKLYKLSSYRFNNDSFKFSFFADIDFQLKDSIVFVGGESTSFSMTVSKTETNYLDLFPNIHDKEDRITILSPSYCKREVLDSCKFCKLKLETFRFITMENGSFIKRSKKYTLLSPGTILYCDKDSKQKIKDQIENENLKKIGFNILK